MSFYAIAFILYLSGIFTGEFCFISCNYFIYSTPIQLGDLNHATNG